MAQPLAVADCVSVANCANRLQALLVRSDVPDRWVPFLFEQTGLRVLRNVLVHDGGALPARVLTAWARGEQHETIADAAVVGDELVVRSCALEPLRIRFDAYPALRRIRPGDRAAFDVDPDGVFLHWPAADVHLDLEAVRAARVGPGRLPRRGLRMHGGRCCRPGRVRTTGGLRRHPPRAGVPPACGSGTRRTRGRARPVTRVVTRPGAARTSTTPHRPGGPP